MQSSMHILQETVKGMQDELKECYVRIRDYEYKEDDWKQVKDRMDSLKTNLIDENAELKSQLTGISLFFCAPFNDFSNQKFHYLIFSPKKY